MSDEVSRSEADESVDPVAELEIDGDDEADLDAAMAEAVAAVEQVEKRGGESAGSELERLRREVEELRERSIRSLADLENYRKRARRQQEEIRRYALVETIREVVSVIDNLERALAAGGSVDDLKQGVEMILRQMYDLLRHQGAQPVAAEGELFDPAVHEAVSRHEDPKVDEPTVTRELQRGYVLHDRLVRPAMVEVAMPGAAERDEDEGSAG